MDTLEATARHQVRCDGCGQSTPGYNIVNCDCGLQIADDGVVRARIEWDDTQDGRLRPLVIDGREIDWDQLGRMLMSDEGWQFKLTLADKSDEL